MRMSDYDLLAAAEAEAAERDLDDERGSLLREHLATAANAAAAQNFGAPPVGFYRARVSGELKPDGWPGPVVSPKRAAVAPPLRAMQPSSQMTMHPEVATPPPEVTRPPRRLLPKDEDVPGRDLTFVDNDPEDLEEDGRPRRGPPGGVVREIRKPWTGLP